MQATLNNFNWSKWRYSLKICFWNNNITISRHYRFNLIPSLPNSNSAISEEDQIYRNQTIEPQGICFDLVRYTLEGLTHSKHNSTYISLRIKEKGILFLFSLFLIHPEFQNFFPGKDDFSILNSNHVYLIYFREVHECHNW